MDGDDEAEEESPGLPPARAAFFGQKSTEATSHYFAQHPKSCLLGLTNFDSDRLHSNDSKQE